MIGSETCACGALPLEVPSDSIVIGRFFTSDVVSVVAFLRVILLRRFVVGFIVQCKFVVGATIAVVSSIRRVRCVSTGR